MEMNYRINFSQDEKVIARGIIEKGIEVGLHATSEMGGATGFVQKFSVNNYMKENTVAKDALIAFACQKAGIAIPETKAEIADAFDNPMFDTVFNSIQKEVILGIISRVQSPQIMAMANVAYVDLGDSYTWEIESKGLPIAQRASYMSNVTIDQTAGMKAITITPKQYSLGVTVDYTRVIANDYDWGRQLAKVALGMLYAQHKLIVGLVFNTANTPISEATFDALKYVTMADNIKALNGGAEVMSFATKPALNKLGSTISSVGFMVKDEYVKQGFIGSLFGVPTVVIDQATDFSAPLVSGVPTVLVPNDKMVLLSAVGDKPVKLVRENFIRVIRQDNTQGATNKLRYSYFMSFDAGIATQQHFGIQSV